MSSVPKMGEPSSRGSRLASAEGSGLPTLVPAQPLSLAGMWILHVGSGHKDMQGKWCLERRRNLPGLGATLPSDVLTYFGLPVKIRKHHHLVLPAQYCLVPLAMSLHNPFQAKLPPRDEKEETPIATGGKRKSSLSSFFCRPSMKRVWRGLPHCP